MAFIDLKLILKTILLLVMLRYAALYALIIVVMLIFGVPTWLIIAIFIMPNFKKSEEQNLPPEPIKIRINRGLNTILLLLSIPIVFRIIILSTQGENVSSIPLNIGFFLFYILLIFLYRKNQQRVRMKTNNCIKEEKRSETYKNGEENIAMILPKEENAQNDNTTMLNNERNVDL